MKKVLKGIAIGISLLFNVQVRAQPEELEQLALNIEKLAQFKQILADMKKGYEILTKGYNTIKSLSKGNFNLHKVFLDGLLAVNPAVSNYKRVQEIIAIELQMVKNYKKALHHFQVSDCFLPGELDYISRVYHNLMDVSVKRLEDLVTVVTASRLRMSDDERLQAIDNIYGEMQEMSIFLHSFNNSTSVLAIQRNKEKEDAQRLRLLYGIP